MPCGAPRRRAGDDGLLDASSPEAPKLISTRDGKRLGHIDTDGGLDNIDYLPEAGLLYIASGKSGVLTIAHAAETGRLELVGSAATASGARTVIADKDGNAYLADSKGGKIWVVKRPPHH